MFSNNSASHPAEPNPNINLPTVSVSVSINPPSRRDEAKNDKNMENFLVGGDRYLRCKVCKEFPEIVRQFSVTKQPAIASQAGTRYRNDVYQEHISKGCHIECIKAYNLKQLKESAVLAVEATAAPKDVFIKKAKSEQADHIGNLFITVFNDAKKLTLSAWSWPSRFVASAAGRAFHYNESTHPTIPANLGLQYVSPGKHAEILDCIVESNSENVAKKLKDAVAISLRVDGSVDRTQIDKIYVLCKIVNQVGSTELLFIGIGDQTEPGASGLLQAIISAFRNLLSEDDAKMVWRK